MIITVYSILLCAITISILVSFAKNLRYRNLILSTSFILTASLSLVTIYTLVGNPVPVNYVSYYINKDVKEADILFAAIKPKESITLLIRVEGKVDPLYVKLPWNNKLAENIQEGQRRQAKEAREGKPVTGMKITRPFADGELTLENLKKTLKGETGSKGYYTTDSEVKYENTTGFVPVPKEVE